MHLSGYDEIIDDVLKEIKVKTSHKRKGIEKSEEKRADFDVDSQKGAQGGEEENAEHNVCVIWIWSDN